MKRVKIEDDSQRKKIKLINGYASFPIEIQRMVLEYLDGITFVRLYQAYLISHKINQLDHFGSKDNLKSLLKFVKEQGKRKDRFYAAGTPAVNVTRVFPVIRMNWPINVHYGDLNHLPFIPSIGIECKITSYYFNLKTERKLHAFIQKPECNIAELIFDGAHVRLESLSKALLKSKRILTKLEFRNSSFAGFEHLARALSDSDCNLTSLTFTDYTDYGSWRKEISVEDMKLLANALSNINCKIKSLEMYCCDLSDGGLKALFGALANENCKLLKLDLRSNNLTDNFQTFNQ
jgi:hypothetical protein